MRRWTQLALSIGLLTMMLPVDAVGQTKMGDWPQWRGPLCNGVAPEGNPPITWSEQRNIKWKIAIPGHGNATPIVCGNRVFILTAVASKDPGPSAEAQPAQSPGRRGWGHPLVGRKPTTPYKHMVLCLDRRTGKTLWQRTACEEIPHQSHHRDGDYASFSPVTDGQHVYAYFGSQGIFCYSVEGERKWEKDLGKMDIVMQFGEGGSPALHKDKLFVNFDHQGDSYLIALDKRTGKTIWKADRDEVTSWSTPFVVDVNGKSQVVVSAAGRVRGYDTESGEVVWQCGGLTRNVIPTPVAGLGKVFVTSGFRGSALLAIELGRRGDLTDSDAVRWQLDRGTPYVPSPLLYGERLYLLSVNTAVLSCYQADSGEPHFTGERLEDMTGVYASPVGVADRIYLLGRSGTAKVIRRSGNLEVLATNTLDDHFDASPAVAGNELFLRGKQHLYCIAEE